MPNIAQLVGEKISEARQIRGYNQDELAKKMGKSRQALSGWETGKKQIPLVELGKLAQVLDFPINFFFEQGTIAEVTGWKGLFPIFQDFVKDVIRQYTIVQEELTPEILMQKNIYLRYDPPLPYINLTKSRASTEFVGIIALENNHKIQINIATTINVESGAFEG